MASTTPNKKAIVDFLWEWTENHEAWSKLLISKVVNTEAGLSDTDRQEVFNYFLMSIALYTGLPPLTITKPTYTPTSKKIILNSLSEISGVNRLAKNQIIDFAKNITVIYGENGTGKTGYSRILRTLGFSYDTKNNVLPNIYEEAAAQNAKVAFTSNGNSRTFVWNGNNSDSELKNISVFNNNCVQFSLSDRNLIVSPMGFHLFNLVSGELNELTRLLNSKIAAHPTKLAWVENLNVGTPQCTFIDTLSKSSTEDKLNQLSSFSNLHGEELERKKKELAGLNSVLLQAEIQTLRAQVIELNSLIEKIEVAQTLLSPDNWRKIAALNKQIAALEGKTKIGLKDIAETRNINFYESEEFGVFIQAAEAYVKVIDKPEYPGEGDTCVYCLQTLDASARTLLQSYRTLLNDKTQQILAELKEEKVGLIYVVSHIETNLTCSQLTFGADENQMPKQPKEITEYNTLLAALKAIFIGDQIDANSEFTFDYQKYITFLTNTRDIIDKSLSGKVETLANLSTLEARLRQEIAELNDRKLLSDKIADVKASIANHKVIHTLQSNANSFNTNAISRKTSTAREELVRQDFEDNFKKELTHLRKGSLKIDLSFGTDKGNSKVYQNISRHALTDILSEGEQKAIALAEFLTELQIDNSQAPVIFDDPVNSLDHRIIDEVVKRLIELSKQRQVIVFTHSILLLHSLIQQSELEHHKQADIHFRFHRVKENFGTTGLLDEVEEINSFSYYTKKLNIILQTKPEGNDEARLAAEGYGHLRSAIEICVEDDLFKKTIKRYKKGVAFPSLLRIDGSKIDTHKGKLNDIYEKCCVSIAGHSSPEELHSTPTMSELKIDFEQFKAVRADFLGNQS